MIFFIYPVSSSTFVLVLFFTALFGQFFVSSWHFLSQYEPLFMSISLTRYVDDVRISRVAVSAGEL